MPWVSLKLQGVSTDLPGEQAVERGSWAIVENAYPQQGLMQSSVSSLTELADGTPLTKYEWLCATRTATTEALVYAGNDIAGPRARVCLLVAGGAPVDLTAGTGWAATATGDYNYWTGGQFSGGVIVNDSTHAPVWIDPAAAAVTAMGAALRFTACRPYKYMAVGIGDLAVAGARNTVRWSASAVPGAAPTVWAPAAGNDAGSFDITSPSAGNLVDGGQLGEDFIVYAENSCHLMTYVGGATVMASRRLSPSTGILARNCYADIGGAHVVLTRDDLVLVTPRGVERSLVDGRLRRTMFANLFNADGRQMIRQVWFDRRLGLVYVPIPQAAPALGMGSAWVWEAASDTWGIVSLDKATLACTTAAMLGLAGAGVGGEEQPRLAFAYAGSSLAAGKLVDNESNPTPVDGRQSTWTIYDWDMGDATRGKLIRQVRPRLDNLGAVSASLTITVGYKDSKEAPYAYAPAATWTTGSSLAASILARGRYFTVEVAYPLGRYPIRALGVDVEYTDAGGY